MNRFQISRKFLFIFPLMFFTFTSYSQTVVEGGPLAGISWYNGDLNPERQFYRIHPSVGGIIRYSLNDRIAFRAGAQFVRISGAYPSSDDIHLRQFNDEPYQFKRNMGDFSALMEINFFSFDHPHQPESVFTPYIAFGLGSTFYKSYKVGGDNDTEKPTFVLSLPFGVGAKWKVNNWFKVGAEWTLRKTFTDDLDLVGTNLSIDPSDPYGFDESKLTHNNDWYSILGIYATFSLFSKRPKCYDGFHNRGR